VCQHSNANKWCVLLASVLFVFTLK
jgi:hypothetical protein